MIIYHCVKESILLEMLYMTGNVELVRFHISLSILWKVTKKAGMARRRNARDPST